ncbi:hypothetical protein GOV12_06005 [Candidatus Pacearchaeota archaeon]|nr:hypothetical protein [Candidatus Pacearchaeota archaeon]
MKMIEQVKYEIGKIEGDLGEYGQKFLITLDGTVGDRRLIYHAHEIHLGNSTEDIPHCGEIRENFCLENIMGGGHLDFSLHDPEFIAICGYSNVFGGVPDSVMEGFMPLLLETYNGFDSRIKRVLNMCHDIQLKECWREFGYEPNFEE